MLHRRDPIFWAATAIFVLSLALAKFVDDGFLMLLVASYLLRPALHSLGFARKLVDERQMQIQYQASNVAFTALVIGNIVVILYLMGKDDHTWEMVNAVLMVGLAVRAIAGLLLVGDPAVAGPRIVMAVGAFLCLFGVVEGGLPGGIVHGLPGLAVIGLGRVYPITLISQTWAFASVPVGAMLMLVFLCEQYAVRRRNGSAEGPC